MNLMHLRNLFFLLFAISGFTGLIYESIWSHYLKLFLGHAAYAQSLVLSIFMGGMAIGAWLISRWSKNWSNLLVIYALVEGLIGIFGICFHPVFNYLINASYNTVIPGLASPASVQIYKWLLATILILPQSILLGMTFPLMSNGILRRFPMVPGKSLSMLYFTNSIGAAVGVLASGFFLIAAVGLPGTILFAGILNILLAIVVYGLAKNQSSGVIPQSNTAESVVPVILISAAFITGMASFIYEIAWLRMLSMVLGASTHSFELMLSAFITGLAFGGLWIRRRIDKLDKPFHFAGIVQIIMGLLALSTVILYNYTFELMAFFMAAISRTDAGYDLFNFFSHFIALVVMLPATFCAGMTLPLFTFILLKNGYGEKSIGQIYASNTIGAIAGVTFTIFIGLPFLGLKGAMLFGCGLDIFLGILLIAQSISAKNKFILRTGSIFLLILGFSSFFLELDINRMSSGVYRHGNSSRDYDEKILFSKDGKTATIHVVSKQDGNTLILTNGKPDASINLNDNELIAHDEPTMVLAAIIPIAINPEVKKIANIGLGSGLTTHTLLAWPGIERVDTIEIEPAIVEGAQKFRPRVDRVYDDPRSKIHIEDAKTFFSLHKEKYDVIISEPSNPWVSGVSSLFTDEFYSYISSYLSNEGMFVQWLQTYEINFKLVLTVISALANNFPYISLYAPNDYELIIIAKKDSPIKKPQEVIFNSDLLGKELKAVGVHNIQDINTRFVANTLIIDQLINLYKPANNSDYFPILDLNSSRTRFKEEGTQILNHFKIFPVPILNMLTNIQNHSSDTDVNEGILSSPNKMANNAMKLSHYITNTGIEYYANLDSGAKLLKELSEECVGHNYQQFWIDELISLAGKTLPYLTTKELTSMWESIAKKCNGELDMTLTVWLNLMLAISQYDYQLIREYSTQLLGQTDMQNIYHKKFVFVSLLGALIKLEEYHAALEVWNKDIVNLYNNSTPLQLQILYSLAIKNNE